MDESVTEILDRFLRFRRSSANSTRRFDQMKHDKHLLPQFQKQIERVLDSYGKLSPITYDTQGVRDQGIDIAVRLHDATGQFQSLVGFQIKAADDLLKEDWLKTLKAQHYEASQIKGLEQYYIVVCVHEAAHKKRLRTLAGDFKTAARTKIIDPTFATTFLQLSQEKIDAYTRRTLAGGDVIVKKAIETATFPSATTGAVLVYLTVRFYLDSAQFVDRQELLGSDYLRNLHAIVLKREEEEYEEQEAEDVLEFHEFSEVSRDFEDQLHHDVDLLSDGPIDVDGDRITVRFEQVMPLIALATDAVVRYEYSTSSVTAYLCDLLDLSP